MQFRAARQFHCQCNVTQPADDEKDIEGGAQFLCTFWSLYFETCNSGLHIGDCAKVGLDNYNMNSCGPGPCDSVGRGLLSQTYK